MAPSPANSHGNGYPLGLAGSVSATRYVGGTATVAPTTGTFEVGDFAVSQNGKVWVCTVAGTPGTWVQVGGGAPSGAAGGDLAGTYPNPTVGNVSILTTKGDTLYESADGVAARLAVGALGQVVQVGASSVLAYGYPPGYQFSEQENATDATTTQTVQASATTVITSDAVTYDGTTVVYFEFSGIVGNTVAGTTLIEIWEDSTDLKRLAQVAAIGAIAQHRIFKRTPTAGSHTYTIRMYVTANTGTCFGSTGAPTTLRIFKGL